MKVVMMKEGPKHQLAGHEEATLRRAAAIVDQIAFLYRDRPDGERINAIALDMRQLMAGKLPGAASFDDKAKAIEDAASDSPKDGEKPAGNGKANQ